MPAIDATPRPGSVDPDGRNHSAVIQQRQSVSRGAVPAPAEVMLDSSDSSGDELYKKYTKRRREMVLAKERTRGCGDRRVEQPVITIKPWERLDTTVPVYSMIRGISDRGPIVKCRGSKPHTMGRRTVCQFDEE